MITPANFEHINNQDVSVYGKHNSVRCVNPYNSRFVAEYPDGRVIYGKDFISTGWDEIPHGLCKLTYFLSTGHVIEIPKYVAYKPLFDCSVGTDGSRMLHHVSVNCLDYNRVVVYRIVLKEDGISKFKIGDIIISETTRPARIDKSWKYT